MKNTVLIGLLLGTAPVLAGAQEGPEFTEEFPLATCQFSPWGGNAYFSLRPGRQLYYSNYRCVQAGECEELEELWITGRGTQKLSLSVDGRKRDIYTRVIEERETADGELVEISRNYFAACWPSRDVYYFGEDVDIYEEGEIVSHDGAWLAGEHGAKPGLIMPESAFLLGSRYFQEVAPDVALDRAEHVATALEVEVPAGVFDDCIEVRETTPLEPDDESTKLYCRGVGLVFDDDLELVSIFNASQK